MHPTKVKFVEIKGYTYAYEASIDTLIVQPESLLGSVRTPILECEPTLHKEWVELMEKFRAARTKAFKQGRLT